MQKNFTLKILLWVIPLLIIVTSPASLARHDQQILDREITIDLKDVPLGVALTEIENIAGVRFVYSPSQLDLGQIISVVAQRKKLREILNDLFGPMAIKYSVDRVKEFILLKPQKAETERSSLQGKEGESDNTYQAVTGKVTDAITQQPIAGVNIVVKGTTSGTTTDSEGEYVITAEDHDILVFSFIGYKKFETQVGGRMIIDVTLEEDVASLKEVVVNAGYYLTTDKMKTGNIARVTAKDIENQPVTSPLMALQGRMAGVDITPFNGAPGGAPFIQIRGQNSLRFDGGYPLYVIDGVPIDSRPIQTANTSLFEVGLDPLSMLNPSNIESIEILKDADATAIYGSRGANGVILITTKRPKKSDKTNIDISYYRGAGKMANKIDLLNTEQYLAMRKEAFENDNRTPGILDFDVNGKRDSTQYTDWQDVLLGGTADISDLQVGISVGNSNTMFQLGGGYHEEGVIFPGDSKFNRTTGHFGMNHSSSDQKLNISLTANYGYTQSNLVNNSNLFSQALNLPPNSPKLYNENGELNWELDTLFGTFILNSWINPLSYSKITHDAKENNLILNSTISYEIASGLIVRTNLGFTDLKGDDFTKSPISANAPTPSIVNRRGSATFVNNNRSSWIIEPQINYFKEFGNHNINAVIGTTWQGSTSNFASANGSGYTSDAFLNSILGAVDVTHSENNSQYRYEAVFLRIGYDLKGKYLLNLTGRRDGSSRFGPGKQFGNFGAVGAAWIFSNEPVIENNISFLSLGKLRGSFGITGNDQIGDYQFLDTYSISQYQYKTGVTINPSSLFNSNFAWEVTEKLETGLELGFLNDRVSIEASWYRNISSNQLIQYQLPATTGFSSVQANFDATVENSGWEFIIFTENIKSSQLRWTTSFNLSFPKNKLVEFDGIEDSPYSTQYKVGEPLTIQWLYKWNGINPETGTHEILDMNEDGNIDDEDRIFMKPLGRKYYGGISNTVSYGNFELSFLFQFSKGNTSGRIVPNPGSSGRNQLVEVLDRWQQEGDETEIPKFSTLTNNALNNQVILSDHNTRGGSFLRLKTLTFSYSLPNTALERIRLQSPTVFIQGQNLLTRTDFDTVLDPETGNSLPPLKVYSIGLQVKI